MTDSIFIKDSNILRYLQIHQKEIKKEYHPIPDRENFTNPIGLEMFMK